MSLRIAPTAPGTEQPRGSVTAAIALALLLLALVYPHAAAQDSTPAQHWADGALPLWAVGLLAAAALSALWPIRGAWQTGALVAGGLSGGLLFAGLPAASGALPPGAGFWLVGLAAGLLGAVGVRNRAVQDGSRWHRRLCAALFGVWVLWGWQVLVNALGVPRVLLPAPLSIAASLAEQLPTLWRDFVQTVLKAVLVGWALGSGLGFAAGLAIDRLPFLQRGLLPLASLTSAVPLVAVAPIAVMWFGFDWPSKSAVVVLMTFFPMLVATRAGLAAAGRLEHELMRTYAAGYGQTLRELRLPCALPYLFGALKVNASLALIGAIVAEFFGSPTVGLGFRISTESARLNMSLVWAAIVVAALTGTAAYAALLHLERRLAFWHPSVRAG